MRTSIYITGICLLLLTACFGPYNLNRSSGRTLQVNAAVETDAEVEAKIVPYRTEMEQEMNEVIVYSATKMTVQKPESLLGNFVADLSLKTINSKATSYKADLCVLNTGGLRAPMPEGAVTRGDIYEIMPFENELVVLHLKGTEIVTLADYVAATGGQPVSGMQLLLEGKKAQQIYIHKVPLDTAAIYMVLTTDYLANGGDDMMFFSKAVKRENTGLKLRDAILSHCADLNSSRQKADAQYDGRVKYVH